MKSNYLIFAGIILLTSGILLKYFSEMGTFPIVLIATGGFCKLAYLILKLIKGNYKPGYEILLLIAGLIMFFKGKGIEGQNALVMMITGISLKVLFVILFIRKIRNIKPV